MEILNNHKERESFHIRHFRKALRRISKYFSTNFEVLVAVIVFATIIIAKYDFYKAIILMLEFIVIMEVIKMISDFIKKETLRLRYVLDIFIIFLVREVIILSTNKNKEHFDILFMLVVISVFFIFRILAIRFSPENERNKEIKDKKISKEEKTEEIIQDEK